MAQARKTMRGRGVPAWHAALAAALTCVLGFGAHAAMTDGGVEIARDDAMVEDEVPDTTTLPEQEEEPAAGPLVHVDGAVTIPGVYELAPDARVVDAVDAAGGLVEGADLSGVNLAASVMDGEKVHIPTEGEEPPAQVPSGSTGSSTAAQDAVVNINTASVEELCTLPGVGEATAAAIVEDRERLGPFAAPEDIMRVSGIGEKKFERMRDRIRVS